MCCNTKTFINCLQTNCKGARSLTLWPACGLAHGGLSRRRRTMSPESAWCCASWARVYFRNMGKSWARPAHPAWTPRLCVALGSVHVRKLTSCCVAAQAATVPPVPDGLLHASLERSRHSPVRPSHILHCCSPDHSDHQHSGLYNIDHREGWKIKQENL